MGATTLINPHRCRMWSFHDRLDYHITEETCRGEIESISKHGQLVPALGRPLRNDPDYDVELVYGARRLFVARHVNQPLLVEVREMSDREAFIAMDLENRHRKDISPYERGISYARWLRSGQFRSQDDIARALKVSASQVSRMLRLAQLPAVIVNAFQSPLEICEAWGLTLMDLLDDPLRRQSTIQRARALGNTTPRPPAREVFQSLVASAAHGRKLRPRSRDEVVRDSSGPLFRVRHMRSSIAVLLPTARVSARTMEHIRAAVSGILHDANLQLIEGKAPASHRRMVDVPLLP